MCGAFGNVAFQKFVRNVVLQKREHLERVRLTCFEFHVFFGRRKGECLFVFLRGLIECVEPACIEVTDKDVEAFGVLDQDLESLKEVLPIFVCDEREVGMSSPSVISLNHQGKR